MDTWKTNGASPARRLEFCINPGQNRCHGVAIMNGLGGPMSCVPVTG